MPKKGTNAKNENRITYSGQKKTIWLAEEEVEALRWKAFKERRSEGSIVREALRLLLELDPPDEDPKQD